MSPLRVLSCLATALSLSPCIARAQSQFGSVTGSVTDPSLAKVSGATIRATNEATNLGFSTETRESGEYLIGGLIPGVYTITAEKTGFKDFRLTGIVVSAGNSSRADLQLTLGATTESVTVSASAVQLNTESGTVAPSAISQYLSMPATIMPSGQTLADTLVPYLPGQTYIGGRAVTAYGSRTYDRRVTLDGAVFGITSTSGVRMPRGTVEELQSSTLLADAQHQTSNTTEMFTAKGTNDFHGAVWTEIQNAALNALNWYSTSSRPPGLPTIGIGFIVGGPAYIPKVYNGRNKTFFHMTFQRYNFNLPGPSSATLPTAQMRAGNLSQQNTPIIDPITRTPFPNATIPGSRISPIAQKAMDQYMPQVPAGAGFAQFNYNTLGLYNQPYHDLFLRADQQIGSKDNVSFSYGYNYTIINQNNSLLPLGKNFLLRQFNFFNASANHIFSPSLLNEVNFGARLGVYGKSSNELLGQDVMSSIGLALAPNTPPGITGGPTLNITGMTGLVFSPASESDERVYTFRDTLSWTRGHSTTKTGFELVRRRTTTTSFANLFGTYNFTGLFAGTGFGDFLLGLPSQTSRNLPPGPIGQKPQQLGFFVNEDYRVRRNLTLNIGFRVQYNYAPIEPDGRYYNFDVKTGNLVVPDDNSLGKLNPGLAPALRARIVTAQSAGFPGRLVNGQLYLTPRFGFAYQLGSNGVVRGGYGIYGTLIANGGATGGPFTPGVQNFSNTNTCNPDTGVCAPAFTLSNPFPTTSVLAVSGLAVTGVNPTLRTPQMHQWHLTGERKLPGDIVFRVSYAGSRSTNLPYRANIALPRASTTPYSQNRLVYPQWFSAVYADSGGNTAYNTLDTEFKRQWRNGFTLNGGYAFSKCLTDSDEGGLEQNYGSFGPLGPTSENPYDRARNKGNCEAIPRHSFRTMYVYDLPFGKGRPLLNSPQGLGRGILNTIVGGWSISGFFLARTGNYFTPLWSGFDAANTGQTLIRTDRICSGKPSHRTWTSVFDTSCFVRPTSGRYGNAGMGIIEGLGYWNYDAGAYKYIHFGNDERLPRLRIGMTSMNIFNHPAKGNTGTGGFIINSSATVARANDTVYNSGVTANLGQWRQIYFEARVEW